MISRLFSVIAVLCLLCGCGKYQLYPLDDGFPETYPRPVQYNEIYDPPHIYYLTPIETEIPADTCRLPCHLRPVMKYEVVPGYPMGARLSGVGAYLTVKAFVDEQGIVRKVRIIRCNRPQYGFEEAVISAVHQCRFYPAQYKSRPVPVWYEYNIAFFPETGVVRNPSWNIVDSR